MCNAKPDDDPALKDPPARVPALTGALTSDNKVAILLEAYKKHSAELLAIEDSQQKLLLLVLGIYAAGITLVGTLLHDTKGMPWRLVVTLSIAAILPAIYAWRMALGRNKARRSVRTALVQVDHALGFFEPDLFLKERPLYPAAWKEYANMRTFLDQAHWIIIISAIAFIATVVFAAC